MSQFCFIQPAINPSDPPRFVGNAQLCVQTQANTCLCSTFRETRSNLIFRSGGREFCHFWRSSLTYEQASHRFFFGEICNFEHATSSRRNFEHKFEQCSKLLQLRAQVRATLEVARLTGRLLGGARPTCSPRSNLNNSPPP